MFFARLGTATPTSSGIGGLLGAGLQAAEETLPAALRTSKNYSSTQEMIADKKETLAVSSREEGVAATKEGRKLAKELRTRKFTETEVIENNERNALLQASMQDVTNKEKELENAIRTGMVEESLIKVKASLATAQANLAAVTLEIQGEYNFPKTLESVTKALDNFQGGDALKKVPSKAKAKEEAIRQSQVEVQNYIMENLGYRATTGQIEAMIIERSKQLLNNPNLITNREFMNPVEGSQIEGNETPESALQPT